MMNFFRRHLFEFASFLVLAGAIAYVWTNPILEIEKVTLEGVDDEKSYREVKDVLVETIDNDWLKQDIEAIQEGVKKLPWIEKAVVTRVFPNELKIVITPFTPIARSQYEGKLIAADGTFFLARDVDLEKSQTLPRISCEPFEAKDAVRLLPQLDRVVAKFKMQVTELMISYRGSWSLRLAGKNKRTMDIELGRTANPERFVSRLSVLVDHFNEVKDYIDEIPQKIDMRYENGFAVRVSGKSKRFNSALQERD